MRSIYVIGSLRNPNVPNVARHLRLAGYEAFDDWYSAGPEADDHWKEYEEQKGTASIRDALSGYAAQHVFAFDKKHLDRCDGAVLVLPAGRSGHLELGYVAGSGKPAFILFNEEPDRWDVMYQFATGLATSIPDLIETIGNHNG